MDLRNPAVYDARYDELERDFIRPRNERTILNMFGRATMERLDQLETEEMRALYAIQDYIMTCIA
jgi:hypothetical protein